ncbi:MAG: mechanosensitive ion channel [Candidatus Eisenbacteria bacterium]|uniref:Mechanosensitive ion channel n=1 Tax=Eiseniibacteriota bacterium TaxID=2212470 RepID=A0A7Y2H2X9_UNCEI|nr:mechanosensitive ion channel [Candidatus Eisenbacteria bacterium]
MEIDLQQIIGQIASIITKYGMQVIGGVLILIAGKVLSGIVGKLVTRYLERAKVDPSLTNFFANLSRIAVLVFAIVAAMAKFGIQTTSFIAVIGAAGLAIGLALQGSLSNFAAGVLILLFKPFRMGDVIEAAGSTGKVKEIGIFTTILATADNQKIIIPNSVVTGSKIVNKNAYDTRRVDLMASIGYGDDIGKAKEVLVNILAANDNILPEPEPVVEVLEMADSSVNFVVRPWVNTKDYWPTYFALTRAIKEQFDENGLSIPFPQRDVHLFQESK